MSSPSPSSSIHRRDTGFPESFDKGHNTTTQCHPSASISSGTFTASYEGDGQFFSLRPTSRPTQSGKIKSTEFALFNIMGLDGAGAGLFHSSMLSASTLDEGPVATVPETLAGRNSVSSTGTDNSDPPLRRNRAGMSDSLPTDGNDRRLPSDPSDPFDQDADSSGSIQLRSIADEAREAATKFKQFLKKLHSNRWRLLAWGFWEAFKVVVEGLLNRVFPQDSSVCHSRGPGPVTIGTFPSTTSASSPTPDASATPPFATPLMSPQTVDPVVHPTSTSATNNAMMGAAVAASAMPSGSNPPYT